MALQRDEAADPSEDFFTEHGISPEVWHARPYVRWTTDDVQSVKQAYAGLSTGRFMVKIARQFPGWVITRHAPPNMGLDRIYPEIRPDSPVFTGAPIRHYHGDGPTPDGVSPRHVHSARNMRWHIERNKFPGDHRGQNSQEVHEHHDPAKYVFPPTPKVERPYFHDHSAFRTAEKRDNHVRRRHGGRDAAGTHHHGYKVKDPESSLAKRIDIHPLALARFGDAEQVFFVIEGCIKADAVLTAGAAVFSVPSVTLWDCAELPAFADRHLKGCTVIIVPDSDWTDPRTRVMTQARLCQTRLRRLGIAAHVAAPPALANGHKQGIDDFLYAGGEFADLEVIDRRLNGLSLHFTRSDQLSRNADVLMALAMHAGPDGRLSAPLRAIARIMGVDVKRVARGLRDLESVQSVTIEGDLSINRKGWVAHNFYNPELDWEERPTIIIAEHNRAIDQPPMRLADFLSHNPK